MNYKERVIKAINKEKVDHVPASFSCHFPVGCENGDAALKAHKDFVEATDTDILKIMNENLVPYSEGIKCAKDWDKIPGFTVNDAFIQRELDLVKRILDYNQGDRFITATLHGAVASTLHPFERDYGYDAGRQFQVDCYRENKKVVADCTKRVCEGMAEFAQKLIEIGCDSVYYASLGAENRLYTDEEFAELVAPNDLMIMKAIKDAGGYCILHMCKDGLNMKRYKSYAPYADIVNWGVYEAPLSLEEGRKLFPGATVLGGFANRTGIIVDGSIDELKAHAKEIVNGFGKTGFIIGADCTLATELPVERVRAIVDAIREV